MIGVMIKTLKKVLEIQKNTWKHIWRLLKPLITYGMVYILLATSLLVMLLFILLLIMFLYNEMNYDLLLETTKRFCYKVSIAGMEIWRIHITLITFTIIFFSLQELRENL